MVRFLRDIHLSDRECHSMTMKIELDLLITTPISIKLLKVPEDNRQLNLNQFNHTETRPITERSRDKAQELAENDCRML